MEQNFDKAQEYYQQAADQGDTKSLINIGSIYANGFGVEQSTDKAIEYLKLAVAQGNEDAQELLEAIGQ